MTAPGWRVRAACAEDVDPEVFFPVAVSGPVLRRQVAAAKAVCARCSVRAECLSDAGVPYGIAGGLTERERQAVRALGVVPVRVGPPPAATRGEFAAAGRAAIRAGRLAAEVAVEFGVTQRTAVRWATRVRAGAA